ncbi:MAG: transcriptional regulator [Chloroflexi bacterium HGW-Chloroflexi-8]|jgi:DNA-binding FrmR family transcriptional regulator|nr:MAG: transcriptional regulator [Chloroflexi bacterium HGW-Chloroflexi-8]
MKINDDELKEKLVHRLKRIEGQVRGVQSMVDDGRQCREILQQLTAIRSAVMSVSTIVLENYMSDCILNLDDKNTQERQELMDDMIQLISKSA